MLLIVLTLVALLRHAWHQRRLALRQADGDKNFPTAEQAMKDLPLGCLPLGCSPPTVPRLSVFASPPGAHRPPWQLVKLVFAHGRDSCGSLARDLDRFSIVPRPRCQHQQGQPCPVRPAELHPLSPSDAATHRLL